MSKALPQVPVTYNFGAVRTNVNDRYQVAGELVSLVNWRRTVEGRLSKRLGNDRTTIDTFVGGTWAGPCTDVVPSSSLLLRDSSDQIWAKAPDGKGYFRGGDLRAHPTWRGIENAHPPGGVHKPLLVGSGSTLFFFSLGVEDGTFTKRIQVSVHDLATGVVIQRPVFVNADDIEVYSAAADPAGAVWVVWVESSAPTVIQVRKLSALGAVLTSNTITVASTEFQDIKLRRMPNSELLLAAVSVDVGGASGAVKRYHAYLDTATGAAKGSPAPVTATVTGGPGVAGILAGPGLSIADSQDDPSSYYYHFWYAFDATTLRCHEVAVDPAALTSSTATARTVTVPGTDDKWIGGTSSSFVAGVVTLFSSLVSVSTSLPPAVGARTATVVRTISGGHTTVARSAYLAGDVFTVGASRYILTGHDDMTGVGHDGAQRGYFVRDSAGKIVTTVLDGVGGQVLFNAGILADGSYDHGYSSGHTVGAIVSGLRAYLPLLQAGSTKTTHEPVLATVDFAPTWDSKAPNIVPGGVPKTVSPADPVTELAPIHFPYVNLAISGNGTAGPTHSRNRAAYRYCTLNADGEITPCAPSETRSS